MKDLSALLAESELFDGISYDEYKVLSGCIGAKRVKYAKNETVLLAGKSTIYVGVLLRGSLQVVHDDFYGNRSIIGKIDQGDMFAESFAFAKSKELTVSIIAVEDSEVIFIDNRRLISPCQNVCGFHSRIILNLLEIVSRKNIALTRKLEISSKRTTREKLLTYLSYEAEKSKSASFTIPFDRQELADYLAVERSAMSAELSRMAKEGLIRYKKNHFEIL